MYSIREGINVLGGVAECGRGGTLAAEMEERCAEC